MNIKTINHLTDLWDTVFNCKLCDTFIFTVREEAIGKEVCMMCIKNIKIDYAKEVKVECTFEEYIDALIVASLLTID